jgi:multicomponent Na+:H+ antiporter subunit E
MTVVLITFIFSLIIYLALTAGSGSIIFWSPGELFFAVVFAAVTAFLSKKLSSITGIKPGWKALNPARWLIFTLYLIGPFFYHMTKANLDVAYRVITGKIRPGIVRISPGLKSDFGMTLLANSITLTPGTLSVDLDEKNNLYVHWIYVKEKEPRADQVCSSFPRWIRRIAE